MPVPNSLQTDPSKCKPGAQVMMMLLMTMLFMMMWMTTMLIMMDAVLVLLMPAASSNPVTVTIAQDGDKTIVDLPQKRKKRSFPLSIFCLDVHS